jgi:hypothetical protein
MGIKEKKESVQAKLQKAIELELATIPPYLTAYYSMRPEINTESAEIIRSVIVGEMLHITLAANLLIATGGKVSLREDNIPHYPLMLEFEDGETFNDREFEVNLAPFSKKTVNVFMQIELPGWQPEDEWLSPKGNFKVEGYTIGQFYESIRKDLLELCNAFGEEKVFTGDPAHQINENYYLSEGGTPIVVTDMESASQLIDEIVEQGEGATGESKGDKKVLFSELEQVAHYFRFSEIYHQRYYHAGDDPKKPPTGEKMPVNFKEVYPIKRNCKSSDFEEGSELWELNNEFNRQYSSMLLQLEQGFNGQPKIVYSSIMNGIRELNTIATKMVQTPIPGDKKGRHGAPSFEWLNTSDYKEWKVVKTVTLNASAKAVWKEIGGFFNMHIWHPDITRTTILPDQLDVNAIRRQKTLKGQPNVLEQLTFFDNEKMYYRYKGYKGPWGEKVRDYCAEFRIIETKPDEQCMVVWSSTFFYRKDVVSKFYKRGLKALKKRFNKK